MTWYKTNETETKYIFICVKEN